MKKIILTATLLLLMVSCSKEEEKDWKSLPAETQEGKDTMGCLVDGELWATNRWGGLFTSSMKAMYYRKRTGTGLGNDYFSKLTIQVRNKKEERIYLSVESISINNEVKGVAYFNRFYKSKSPRIIITKLDTINKIVSGRFSFTGVNEYTQEQDTVKITDGRFDIKSLIMNDGDY